MQLTHREGEGRGLYHPFLVPRCVCAFIIIIISECLDEHTVRDADTHTPSSSSSATPSVPDSWATRPRTASFLALFPVQRNRRSWNSQANRKKKKGEKEELGQTDGRNQDARVRVTAAVPAPANKARSIPFFLAFLPHPPADRYKATSPVQTRKKRC